jgi:alpha-L-rhamnosidase
VHGKVVSEWTREAGKFRLRVRVPVGVTATVILPAKDGTPVTESGKPVEHAPGVERLTRPSGRVLIAVGSGEYEFGSEL